MAHDYSASQMQQAVAEKRLSDIPKQKQGDLFDQYREAAQRYHNACHAAQQAQLERASAEKHLLELSRQVEQTIQQVMADPTVPQGAQLQQGISTPGNSRW